MSTSMAENESRVLRPRLQAPNYAIEPLTNMSPSPELSTSPQKPKRTSTASIMKNHSAPPAATPPSSLESTLPPVPEYTPMTSYHPLHLAHTRLPTSLLNLKHVSCNGIYYYRYYSLPWRWILPIWDFPSDAYSLPCSLYLPYCYSFLLGSTSLCSLIYSPRSLCPIGILYASYYVLLD